MTLRPGHPARWSHVTDKATIDALKSGRVRLGITVVAFEPPQGGPTVFVVHSVPAEGEKRREIDRFEITPSKPFRVTDGAAPQRFFINIRDHVSLIKDAKINFDVGFDESSGKLSGGMAEVRFDLVTVR